LLASSPRGLSHLSFVEAGAEAAAIAALRTSWPNARTVRDDDAAGELAQRIWSACAGPPQANPVPLKLAVKGTNFQLKVWEGLIELGASGPTTYEALARAAAAESAPRAVGNAVAANPVAWLIPCHNVLRKNGALGGYRWGPDRKRAMLAWQALHGPKARAVASRAGHEPLAARQAT
ncbi:MAG TPA: methylated-DNA--[protein]-cysteine S-methyltransferase, partial [Steroidobacteraceae bacterium]|nr:methylated-DNA--[protein]-cysteine S-methyltransferase [Steroidobacteraceae bacterium]